VPSPARRRPPREQSAGRIGRARGDADDRAAEPDTCVEIGEERARGPAVPVRRHGQHSTAVANTIRYLGLSEVTH